MAVFSDGSVGISFLNQKFLSPELRVNAAEWDRFEGSFFLKVRLYQ
ncbi:MAG: hypothetical protein LBR06_06820 [Bacteroidales bacterium]|nr:hypothetical protein [Bacteroidales bacterium]